MGSSELVAAVFSLVVKYSLEEVSLFPDTVNGVVVADIPRLISVLASEVAGVVTGGSCVVSSRPVTKIWFGAQEGKFGLIFLLRTSA